MTKAGAPAHSNRYLRWLWVPAFAGLRRDDSEYGSYGAVARISLRSIRASDLPLPPERGKVGMGVSRGRCCVRREQIPARFALASKATSPFQGEVEPRTPDVAALHAARLLCMGLFSIIWQRASATASPRSPDKAKRNRSYGSIFPFPLKGGRSGWGSAAGDAVCGESRSPPALLWRAKRPPFFTGRFEPRSLDGAKRYPATNSYSMLGSTRSGGL